MEGDKSEMQRFCLAQNQYRLLIVYLNYSSLAKQTNNSTVIKWWLWLSLERIWPSSNSWSRNVGTVPLSNIWIQFQEATEHRRSLDQPSEKRSQLATLGKTLESCCHQRIYYSILYSIDLYPASPEEGRKRIEIYPYRNQSRYGIFPYGFPQKLQVVLIAAASWFRCCSWAAPMLTNLHFFGFDVWISDLYQIKEKMSVCPGRQPHDVQQIIATGFTMFCIFLPPECLQLVEWGALAKWYKI